MVWLSNVTPHGGERTQTRNESVLCQCGRGRLVFDNDVMMDVREDGYADALKRFINFGCKWKKTIKLSMSLSKHV